MHAILFITAVVAMTTLGDYFLKLASDRESLLGNAHFLGGALIYGLSAVGWVYAMRHLPLASIGVYYAMLSLLLVVGLGVVVFGEKLSGREALGILFAFASIGLTARLH
ncbi:transporter [Amaricoccus solimangrovi]|uniref:Transporter n=1 Tax=Amaricoccus solimangrovi TaxID=2589815 RepID=A0A501WM04_9RHOB|nr:transporter [Amaricoccus solimangrovi]TPE48267.1 transporter [Amaricoccus solimangrovi]